MKLYGKEYGLFLNTWATGEIADLCPGGKLQNLAQYLDQEQPQKELFRRVATLAVILNKADCMTKRFNGEDVSGVEPLETDMILSLSVDEFLAAQTAVVNAIAEGSSTTVKVEQKNVEGEAKA